MRTVPFDQLQPFQAVNLLLDGGHVAGPKIIPNCAMVRLNWQLNDGKVAHNVMYAQWSGSPALSTAAADAVFGLWRSNWTSVTTFMATGTTMTGITLLDVRSSAGVEINSTAAAMTGTSTGTALPDEVSVAITLRTALRGQGGRGRIYIPGWASNAVGAGGVVAAGAVTGLQTLISNVNGGMSGAIGPLALGLPHRIAYTSPITGRAFPDRPAVAQPVLQVIVRDNHFDSQRRRGLR